MDGALPLDHLPGANHPPEPVAPANPYLAHKLNIEGLFEEAKHWIDGTEIANEDQAEKVQTLLRMIQEAETAADASRVAEKKPLDDKIADIQGRYNPLIAPIKNSKPGLTALAAKGCLAALTIWLNKKDAEQKAEAERLRLAAEKAADEARALIAAAHTTPDLEAMEQAQEAIVEAQQVGRAADRAEKARPTASGYGRAVGLKTYYTPALADPVKALGWAWINEREAMEAALLAIARTRTHGGVCTMPGITLTEERRA